MALVGPLETCPRCGVAVRKGDLLAHLSITHGLTSPSAPSPTSIQRTNKARGTATTKPNPAAMTGKTQSPSRQLVACPHCKSMYREDHLSTHLAQDMNRRAGIAALILFQLPYQARSVKAVASTWERFVTQSKRQRGGCRHEQNLRGLLETIAALRTDGVSEVHLRILGSYINHGSGDQHTKEPKARVKLYGTSRCSLWCVG